MKKYIEPFSKFTHNKRMQSDHTNRYALCVAADARRYKA